MATSANVANNLNSLNSVCRIFDPATQKHPLETTATKRSRIEHMLVSGPDVHRIMM